MVSCGISTPFDALFPSDRQVTHALLTRPPLELLWASSPQSPLDLHVLGTPPAFVLSQDQTLMFNPSQSSVRFRLPRTVVSLRNLTVLCSLSLRPQPSRSSRTLFLLVCLHYIVFKDRSLPSLSRWQHGLLYTNSHVLSTTFFNYLSSYYIHHFSALCSKSFLRKIPLFHFCQYNIVS